MNFIILKIEFRQNENVVLIRKSEEYCKIQTDNKAKLKSWMKILFQNCGFKNIYGKNKIHKQEIKKVDVVINSLIFDKSCETDAGKIQSKVKSLNNSSLNLSQAFFHTFDCNLNNSKSVAGILALSVGSVDLLNPEIDILFKNRIKKCLCPQKNLNLKSDSYLNLEECKSGLEKELNCRKCSISIELKNKLKCVKNISSNSLDKYIAINKDSLDTSDSFIFQDLNDRIIFNVSVSVKFYYLYLDYIFYNSWFSQANDKSGYQNCSKDNHFLEKNSFFLICLDI